MKKRWVTYYMGHEIEVEKSLFCDRLWIDNTVASKHMVFAGHRELSLVIEGGEGAGEEVKCLVSGVFQYRCQAWINSVPASLTEKGATLADLAAFFFYMFSLTGVYRLIDHGYRPAALAVTCASVILAVALDSWPRRKSPKTV